MADVLDELLGGQQQSAATAPAKPAPAAPSGGGDVLDQLLGSQAAQAPKAAAPEPTAAATPEHIENLQWSDVPGQAVSHLGTSAYGLASNIGHALIHPIQTAETLGDVGMGVLEKMGIKTGEEHIPLANAVGKMFADRYGGMENLKQTLATDPLGAAMDFTSVLGGGGALLRGAGLAGAADVAGTAARLTNPLTAVGKAAQVAGKGAAELVGGLTHAGAAPLEYAAEAGYEGGSKARAFRENITGRAPIEEVAEDARAAINAKMARASAEYNSRMANLGKNPSTVQLTDIQNALTDELANRTYQGRPASEIPIPTDKVLSDIGTEVAGWQQRGPSALTPAGVDVLKRNIGNIAEGLPRGSPEARAAWRIYYAARDSIAKQAPEYKEIMEGYEQAKDAENELRRAFTLPINERKAAQETAIRKLQSVMRDKVNTNFGQKRKLAEVLSEDAPDLMYKLAGQSLNPLMAHGLGKLTASLAAEGVAMLGGVLGGAGLTGGLIGAGALAPFTSPRIMGNVAYRAGQAARPFRYNPLVFQAGRIGSEGENP